MYSKKTIKNLKPEWYSNLSTKEKNKLQDELKKEQNELWNNKPVLLPFGTRLVALKGTTSITRSFVYYVINHFCTLVSTIYGSEWRQFVTIKSDNGFIVKTSLKRFTIG